MSSYLSAPALARRVQTAIRRQPDRFDQQRWFGNRWLDNPWLLQTANVDLIQKILASPMPAEPQDDLLWGMTACVGGFTVVLAAPPYSRVSFSRQTISLTGGGTYEIREYAAFELGLSNLDGDHYLFLPRRDLEEVDAALSVIADQDPGRWAREPLWSLTHARLGRPVADRPVW
jgi:hypothetical protein